jgi:hypothetical protein
VPLFNQVKAFGSDVAKVLEPGERLIAMGGYQPPHVGDTSDLERPSGEPAGPDRLVEGVDWTGVQLNPDRVNRAVGGTTGTGGSGSIAGQLWREATNAPAGLRKWAVTDRRLLLLVDTLRKPTEFRIHFAVPRPAIRSARRRGRFFLQWGRVELTFADGSTVALTLAMFDVGAARQMTDALSVSN